jgi:hypothetical protein
MSPIEVVHITRGERVTGDALTYQTRGRAIDIVTPALDAKDLTWPRWEPPPALNVPIKEVIEFLVETGRRLDLDSNDALATACRNTSLINHLAPGVVENFYRALPRFFQRELLEFEVEQNLGSEVDGWRQVSRPTGTTMWIRPFPIRILHFLAGNAPGLAALTVARSSLSRGTHLLKLPSNDLFTAPAIIETMATIDAHHPVVRSHSAAYWRGGDDAIESLLFRSEYFDTVVAWGGASAIRNVQKYVGPGIDLVALNPKVSISLIGREAFASDALTDQAAAAAAVDVGHQEACQDSRFHFVEAAGADLDRYCELLLHHLQSDRLVIGGRPTPAGIKDRLSELAAAGTRHQVWGNFDGSGLVIRSDTPLDIYPIGRTVNVIGVSDLSQAARHIDSSTQTVGVFPSERRTAIRDVVCAAGTQRVAALGLSIGKEPPHGRPHDGYYVLHRMVRWVVDEDPPEGG